MTVDVRELLDSLSLNEFNGSNLLVDQILSSWKPGVDVRVDAKVVVWVASRLDQDKILEISRTIPIATLLLGCYDECVNVLRPFFEDSKKTALSSSSLIREQLTPSQVCPSDQLAVWDNESSWKTSDSIKNAPLWIVSHLDTDSIDKYERASKFIPFILLVAEDYEPSIRLHGVRIIREYLRCVSDRILSQMQLYHLFRKTLMTNLSFDDVDLKRESLELLTGRLIMPIKSIPQEIQLEWAESLLSVLMREVLFCKEDVVRSILLSFIPALIRGLGLASVCYIKNVLALLMDLPLQDRGNDIVFDILSALFDCTWPRLGRHGLIVNQVLSQIGDGEDQSRVLQFKNRMALLAPSVTINTIRPSAYTNPRFINTFLGIIEAQIKSSRCSQSLIAACRSFHAKYPASVDGSVLDKSLSSSLEWLQRAGIHSEESLQMLTVLILLKCVSQRVNFTSQRKPVVDSIVGLDNLGADTFELLYILFEGKRLSLFVEVINNHGWQRSLPTLVPLLALVEPVEREYIMESLGDNLLTADDALIYLQLIQTNVPMTKMLLVVHDLFSRLDYQLSDNLLERFLSLLRIDITNLISDGSIATASWVFSSYAVNMERFLRQLMKRTLSESSERLVSLLKLINTLAITGLIERPLKTLILLVSHKKQLVSLDFIDQVGQISPEICIRTTVIELWKVCCTVAIENHDLLPAIFRSFRFSKEHPWLLDPCLRPCFDPNNSLFWEGSTFWIPGMQQFLTLLLSLDPPFKDFALKEEVNYFFLQLLSIFRNQALKSKKSGTHILMQDKLCDLASLLSDSAIYLVAFGDKKWSYYTNEISHTVRWVAFAGQVDTLKFPSLFFCNILERIHEQKSVRSLICEQRSFLFWSLLIEYLLGNGRCLEKHISLISGRAHLHSFEQSEFRDYVFAETDRSHQGSPLAIRAKEICKANVSKRLLALRSCYQERVQYLEVVLIFSHDDNAPTPWTIHLLEMAAETLTYSSRIIAGLAEHVMKSGSSALVDAFDAYLYSICSQVELVEKQGTCVASRTLGMFLLNRLTSIFIARGEASGLDSDMTRALIDVFVKCCNPVEINRYLCDLLTVLECNSLSFFDAFRRNLFVSIIKVSLLLRQIPLPLLWRLLPDGWTIETSQRRTIAMPAVDASTEAVELKMTCPQGRISPIRLPLRLAKCLSRCDVYNGRVVAFEIAQAWRKRVTSIEFTFGGMDAHQADLIIADEGLVFACFENHPLCNVFLT